MKGKIKVLSLLLAVAMTASMFVACAKDPATDGTSNGGGTGTDTSKDASKPAEKKENVKLKWYHWGESPSKPDAVVKALNEKSLADIQTEIDFVFANDEEAVKMLCSTGGEYDIVFTCSWYNNFVVAATGGQFADITDLVQTASPDLYAYIPEAVWGGAKVGGKIYAVPTYKDTAPEQFWMANKSYVIDGAKAEAEFKATGEKLSTVTPLLEKVQAYAKAGTAYPNDLTAPFNFNVAGLNGHDTGWDMMDTTIFTGVKLDGGTKVMNHLEDADYVEQLKTLKDWNTRGLVNKNALQTEAEPTFLVVGTVQGWAGCEGVLTGKFTTEVVTNHKYGPVYTTSGIQGSMNALSPNSKNQDRSLQYLQYANMDTTYRNMLAYGIEGANWEKAADGTVKRLNDDWKPGAFSQASFFTMIPEAPSTADMYVNLKAIMDGADSSPIVGLVPTIDAVKTEVAACAAIIEPVKKELLTGSVKDVDAKVKETLDALKGVGYEKIRAELQKQVDAFIAAK